MSTIFRVGAGSPSCQKCGSALVTKAGREYGTLSLEQLRSTHVVSAEDAATIQGQLAGLEGASNEINAALDSILATADLLRRSREEIQTAREQRRSLLAPIRRLPVMILAAIFLERAFDLGRPERENGLEILRLGHVCLRWREVAIATPGLWTLLSHPRATVALLKNVWIPRSMPLPLEVKLLRDNTRTLEHTKLREILEVVISASDRWRVAKLWIPEDNLDLFLQSLDAPTLSALSVETSILKDGRQCHAFRTAWELRTFHFKDFFAINPVPLYVPWSRLHKVVLNASREEHMRCLRECAELETYEMALDHDGTNVLNIPWKPIHHPTLRNFTLHINERGLSARHPIQVLPSLFASLTLPKLASLFISGHHSQNWQLAQTPFQSFLTRSQCRLHSVRLRDMDADKEQVVQFFEQTSSLRHLSVKHNTDHRELAFTAPSLNEDLEYS